MQPGIQQQLTTTQVTTMTANSINATAIPIAMAMTDVDAAVEKKEYIPKL